MHFKYTYYIYIVLFILYNCSAVENKDAWYKFYPSNIFTLKFKLKYKIKKGNYQNLYLHSINPPTYASIFYNNRLTRIK